MAPRRWWSARCRLRPAAATLDVAVFHTERDAYSVAFRYWMDEVAERTDGRAIQAPLCGGPGRGTRKRRRIKTVLQEVMYRAAKFVEHARRLVLDFGRGVAAHVQVFATVQARLCAVASP